MLYKTSDPKTVHREIKKLKPLKLQPIQMVETF
jgi:hypothetical protein